MTLHPSNRRWLVVVRDPEGREVQPTNVTADVGWPQYDEVCANLRAKLDDGWTLDSTEADERHRQLTLARVRWDAAYQDWFSRGAPTGGHPGSLADYMPEEVEA